MAWNVAEQTNFELEIYQHTLTSTGGGNAAVAETDQQNIRGFVVQIHINVDGVAPPDANWDLTLTDANGVDLTFGQGVDLSGADETLYQSDLANGIACEGPLTISAAQMGASKIATITVYVARYA